MIVGEWKTTGTLDNDGNNAGERFLLADNGLDAECRIIIFASDDMLNILGNASEWWMDGNFKLAPKGFLQLYVIRACLDEVLVTTTFILMQNKSRTAYDEMFAMILEECASRDIVIHPQSIHVDFEAAVISSFREIIDSNTNINGCLYHLCQSTFRKIQNLGLQRAYTEDTEFNVFCGMIDGLAFLPISLVHAGMLNSITTEQAQPLLDYFDSTYVSGKYINKKSSIRGKITMRRIPPMFPPEQWNVFDIIVNGGDCTNNKMEGWNNRFKNIVGLTHPSIWVLIKKMQAELATDRAKLIQQDLGIVQKKKKRQESETRQMRLKNICAKFSGYVEDVPQFLKKISEVIRFRAHYS